MSYSQSLLSYTSFSCIFVQAGEFIPAQLSFEKFVVTGCAKNNSVRAFPWRSEPRGVAWFCSVIMVF